MSPRPLRLPAAMLAVLAALLSLAWAVVHGESGPPAPGVVLRAALFSLDRPGAPAQWQPVALPDTWARRGLREPGRAIYRAAFDLPQAPAQMWGLRIDRLSTHHEVRVNGELVHGSLSRPPPGLRRPLPTLVTLPPALLHAGRNELEIRIDSGQRAGLAPLQLGPLDALEPDFVTGYHVSVQLPQMLNVISAGACLVALFIWWRRRSEAALGAFAVLGLLTSARNFSYYTVVSFTLLPVYDWLFYAAQVLTVALLAWFRHAISGRDSPRRVQIGFTVTAVLIAAGGVAAALGRINTARAVVYPLLLAYALVEVVRLARSVRKLPGTALTAVVACLAAVLGAGAHDYLYQQGYTSVMDGYWMPYAVPVAVVAFTAMLVRRTVDAMHAVELLNASLEQRVQERTLALEAANAAKGRFVAAASHDLRQPVSAIGLLVGLLREQVAAPRLRELVARIDQAVAALESLLTGLLDLSRLDAGTVQARLERVALQEVFDAIAAHEGEAARAKGLLLRFRPTALAAVSDRVLLEQMLRNLVSNAVRCTHRGGVLVAARRHGTQVRVQVWDTGIGMTPAQQATAFEEFVQFDRVGADGRVRGLGLGLAIVQRSARLLGHPLSLRSVPGRGSCFTVEMPAERRSAQAPAPAAPDGALPLQHRRVLVVEDEAAVREALQLRLEGWGAEVLAFGGVQELQAAPARGVSLQVDVVLTDQRLPDGDGLAVVDWLRARMPALPALVVTGTTLPSELARLQRCGLPVLNKPFRAETLLAAVQAACAGR